MKLWKYIHFSEITQSIPDGMPIKEPFIWAETQPDSDYDDITSTQALLEKIVIEYKQYEKDGKAYFEKIRADLVLLFKTNQKTDVDIFLIEQKLEGTINKIVRGDWMTALNTLNQVIVEAPLDQSLHDEIHLYITNYIVNNY